MTDNAAEPAAIRAGRILVVDDEPAIRRLLRITLEAEGYTVLDARTGREAVDQVAAHRPELIILDLGLPDLDGFEVLRLLREQVQTPIIVESVREQEADKMRAAGLGRRRLPDQAVWHRRVPLAHPGRAAAGGAEPAGTGLQQQWAGS